MVVVKITRDQATAEVTGWLDKKKVYETTRELQKDSIDILIEAVMRGDLKLNPETFVFTHTLLEPESVNNEIKELTYKPRLNDKMLKPYLNGVKTTDAEGRLLAYVSALTGQVKGVLESLDSADKKIMLSIAVFFL
jgi:hypothetical protein